MKNVFIIIVRFKNDVKLEKLLQSLSFIKRFMKIDLQILIIDNSNKNDILKFRSSNYIQIIKNSCNFGFAKAVNIGIKYALSKKADGILLLNPDLVLTNDFLLPLIRNSSDIVSPVIKFKRKNIWVYDRGGKVNWNIGRVFHIETSELSKSINKEWDIDFVSGCCMFIRTKVFEKIGLFNERFFMYFEDVDFCIRAKKSGFNIGVEKNSIVWHKYEEGINKPFRKQLYLLKSNFIFINKYLELKKPLGYLYVLLLAFKIIINYLFRI